MRFKSDNTYTASPIAAACGLLEKVLENFITMISPYINIQYVDGLHAGNKLKQRHIDW